MPPSSGYAAYVTLKLSTAGGRILPADSEEGKPSSSHKILL